MWPWPSRSTLGADERAAARRACIHMAAAYAACRAANAAVADRACAPLAGALAECLGRKAAPVATDAYAECVSKGGSKCEKELRALEAALKRERLWPPAPPAPRRRRQA
jgi:hypothetical protein